MKQNHARIFAATTIGVDAFLIEVEADISMGLMNFFIVGLADKSIKESKDRIKSALKNCNLKLPDRLITINLAPADIKKQDALFDVPIAVAILCATRLITVDRKFLDETVFLGELALDGKIRSIKGALPICLGAKKAGKKRLIIPAENAFEAALVEGIEVIGVSHLDELVKILTKEEAVKPVPVISGSTLNVEPNFDVDYAQVKGQAAAKRALIVAAAGGHNILFIGPPGGGKSMLAERVPTILPGLSFDQAVEVTKIYSVAGQLKNKSLVSERPFRAPHHTISQVGLVGGGANPLPGEISMAHHGVLFLDEFAEFSRSAIEALRQPMQSGEVTISRALCTITYPANFLLVAALNPCPCGYFKDVSKKCSCSDIAIKKYLSKISGPILDRIDIHISVLGLNYQEMAQKGSQELSSKEMKEQVLSAIEFSKQNGQQILNSEIAADKVLEYCKLDSAAEQLVEKFFAKTSFSARSYHKILRLAKTIADVDKKTVIDSACIREAISYRCFDKAV